MTIARVLLVFRTLVKPCGKRFEHFGLNVPGFLVDLLRRILKMKYELQEMFLR